MIVSGSLPDMEMAQLPRVGEPYLRSGYSWLTKFGSSIRMPAIGSIPARDPALHSTTRQLGMEWILLRFVDGSSEPPSEEGSAISILYCRYTKALKWNGFLQVQIYIIPVMALDLSISKNRLISNFVHLFQTISKAIKEVSSTRTQLTRPTSPDESWIQQD